MFVEQKKMIILVLILVVVLVLAGVGYRLLAPQAGLSGTLGGTQSASGSSASSATAQPAPDFTVYDADGGEVTLASLMEAGKPAVLNFWASTCPPCKEEMPDFQAAFEQYGQEIQFVMVNVGDAMQGESRERAEAFLAETGYTFPVYYDIDYQGILTYGVTGFPHTYFIDGQGDLQLYAPGKISAQGLQQGLHSIRPDLVPAPEF